MKISIKNILVPLLITASVMAAPAASSFNESYKGSSSYVTMYNFKSPYGVDWSSPSSLATSSIKNSLAHTLGITKNPRQIGHVSLEISCQNAGGKNLRIMTGMGSVDSQSETIKLLMKNSAMGVLFHRFKGKLDDPNELVKDIADGRKAGYVNSVTYLIDDSACAELAEHHKKWIETKAYLNYGLIEKPLEYTGAGCSAYVMSYLDRVVPKEHKNRWKGHVLVANELIGVHNRKPYKSQEQEFMIPEEAEGGVSIFQLLLSADTWAKAGEAATRLDYWSPDMMYDWAKEAAESYKRGVANQSPIFPVKVEKTYKTHNVIFDSRKNLISKNK